MALPNQELRFKCIEKAIECLSPPAIESQVIELAEVFYSFCTKKDAE